MGPEWASLTGGGDRVRLFPVDPWGVAPQSLEVVVVALRGTEDVDDHVDVVGEPPSGVPLALASSRTHAQLLLQGPLDLLDHTLDLPARGRGADHEVIRDHDQPAHVEDHDVLGLLRGGGSGGDGGRVAARRDLPASPLLVRIRHSVKSSPTMIVMSPIPDGTRETPTRPTPSARRIRSASGTAAAPFATTFVRSYPNGSAFCETTTRKPSGSSIAATSSPRPGAPTPFSTITGTGSPQPNTRATSRSRSGCSGTSTLPATETVGKSESPAPAESSRTRSTPSEPLDASMSSSPRAIGSLRSPWTTDAQRASPLRSRTRSSATTCSPFSSWLPGPSAPAWVGYEPGTGTSIPPARSTASARPSRSITA